MGQGPRESISASPFVRLDRAQHGPPAALERDLTRRAAAPLTPPEPRRNPFAVWQQTEQVAMHEAMREAADQQTSARRRAEGEVRRQQQQAPAMHVRHARDADIAREHERRRAEREREEAVLREYESRASIRAPQSTGPSGAASGANRALPEGAATALRAQDEAEARARLGEQRREAEMADVRRVEAVFEARSSASSSSSAGGGQRPGPSRVGSSRPEAPPARGQAAPPEPVSGGVSTVYDAIDSLSKWWYG